MPAPSQPPPGQPAELLAEVRRRRAELRHAMGVLEQAIGAPVTDRPEPWVARVRNALLAIGADFRLHVEVTEGPNGLYEQVLAASPRLAGPVRRLSAEHRALTDSVAELLAWTEKPADHDAPPAIRRDATDLLALLARHRQQGADLLYEAYASDIGGET